MAVNGPDPSIEDILRSAKLPVDLPPSMARGVDLSIVRAKKDHPHRWCVLARYIVDDDIIAGVQEQIDTANAEAVEAKKRGEEPQPAMIQVPLEHVYLVSVEGPGCQKCGVHMTAPTGNGHLCEKSDSEFAGMADYYAQKCEERLAILAQEGAGDAADA